MIVFIKKIREGIKDDLVMLKKSNGKCCPLSIKKITATNKEDFM